jgi:hypothetical protein
MVGFLGDSDRQGLRRLYFTRDLDYYAEFRVEDIVEMASIPAEALPFLGDEATRVTLRRDTTIEYTRVRTARPLDQFDLDVQLGGHLVSNPVYEEKVLKAFPSGGLAACHPNTQWTFCGHGGTGCYTCGDPGC